MKIMMSAGEASGDMHAAAVAAEIKREYPDADIFGMGGDNMRNAGVRIIYDIGNLGIIGVVEVIRHLSLFFKLRTFLRHAMMEEKPDVVVCVDYPGFNMKIAHVAKELGIPVVYYIAPTIWAWHKGRAKNIVRDVEHVASIFPFEAEAYREAGARVTFVGHPLADTVKASMSYEEAMMFFGGDRVKKEFCLCREAEKMKWKNFFPPCLKQRIYLLKNVSANSFCPVLVRFHRSLFKIFKNDFTEIGYHCDGRPDI